MAMLEIDKLVAAIPGALRRDHVIVDQGADLAVGDERMVGRHMKLAVEYRVAIQNARLHAHLVVGLAKTPGVRQLQADHQTGIVPHCFAVRSHQGVAQGGNAGLAGGGHSELVGIGAAVMAHRHRFTAPDHLGPGQAEITPAADGVVGRPAILQTIPAFHRLDRKPIADGEFAHLQRHAQR